jgi:hypothetical protein
MAEQKWPRAIQKLLKGLGDAEAAGALVGAGFDFALAQPVRTYVDPERLLGHLDRALDERVVEAYLRDHVRPFFDREAERAVARDDRVGDWLTAEAQAELRALAAKPVEFDRRFLEGLVKQDSVRHMLRSVIEETLDRFVQSVKQGLSTVSGGRLGGGKGLLGGITGGITGQFEQLLQRAVGSFVGGSMNLMLERLVAILSSPETARQLGRSKLQAYDAAVKTPTRKVAKSALKAPLDDLLETVPGLIAHNLARPEVRVGIVAEVEAFLAIEGERPVGDLLADEDAVAALRGEVVEVAGPLLSAFAEDPGFLAWLAEHC